MLMGSAEVVAKPTEAVKFVEDMTAAEKAETGVTTSAGLVNLGNTCYMNSTVQCMRHIPELRDSMKALSRQRPDTQDKDFVCALSNTFDQLDTSTVSLPPVGFVGKLRSYFPQFAQQGQGGFMQQDAEEFFNILSMSLNSSIDSYDSMMSFQLEEQLTCTESDAEAAVKKFEKVNKLVCNIQGGVGQTPVDHIADGIKLAFEGTLEKRSEVLGRDALWNKKARISSLPRYLCVHFMRFFWKATPEARDSAGTKCKILRAVNFNDTLDVYDFCSEDMQAKLRVNRDIEDAKIEAKLGLKSTDNRGPEGVKDAGVAGEESKGGEMDVEDPEEAAALAEALAMSVGGAPAPASAPTQATPVDIGNGLPEGFTGAYELFGLVTHKGRSADSGHYIGWVRQENGSNLWWQYNDDTVTECRTEDILLLKGGGDRDMAYLSFYRFKNPRA
jgi:ubiquitin carboxyl-terminal hydrolase 14